MNTKRVRALELEDRAWREEAAKLPVSKKLGKLTPEQRGRMVRGAVLRSN